jgi:DNA-binding Xre family transcriptional regulator
MGHLRHKLLDLIHEKEKKLGRRLTAVEIAGGANVSERLVYRWLKSDKGISRFDESAIVGFCDYFGCQVGDLLIYEEDDEPFDI